MICDGSNIERKGGWERSNVNRAGSTCVPGFGIISPPLLVFRIVWYISHIYPYGFCIMCIEFCLLKFGANSDIVCKPLLRMCLVKCYPVSSVYGLILLSMPY